MSSEIAWVMSGWSDGNMKKNFCLLPEFLFLFLILTVWVVGTGMRVVKDEENNNLEDETWSLFDTGRAWFWSVLTGLVSALTSTFLYDELARE
jgi:hypothetical protein